MRADFLVSATILSSLALPCCFGCPNKCSRNGTCTPLGICSCNNGFTGGDCSIRTCPSAAAFSDVADAVDVAHRNLPCSGKGTCVNGTCLCSAGFTGTACERSKLIYKNVLDVFNLGNHLSVFLTPHCFFLWMLQQNVRGIAAITADAYRCDISQRQHETTNLGNIHITNGTRTRFTAAFVIWDIKVGSS